MATASVPNNFSNGVASDADAVDANFTALVDFLNANVAHKDGATFTGIVKGIDGIADEDLVTKAQLDDAVGAGELTGVIKMWGGAAAPTGYFLCNGGAVSRSTYSALFAVIGTTYGAGDASTTFNVPDLLGRSPMGAGSGSGLSVRALGTELGSEGVYTGVTVGTSRLVSSPEGSFNTADIAHVHAVNVVHPVTVVTFIIKF